MPELVTIPNSYFELAVDYAHPNLRLWGSWAAPVQVVFDALRPWNPKLENIELTNSGKISEQGFSIKLPLKSATFFFGLAQCRFTQEAVSWESAAETINIIESAFSALCVSTGLVMGAKTATIAVHLQPQKLSFLELLKPFLHTSLLKLDAEPLRTGAVVMKWDTRKVTLDGSAMLANGVFLRLERTFESSTTYPEMALQLKKDEDALLAVLGVEEDRR